MALTSKYFKFIIYVDDKTLIKFMIFHQPRKKITIPSLEINNTKLKCVNRFNFLGLEINAQLTWKDHVNKISNKIVKTLGIMNKLKNVFPQSALILL